MTDSKVIVFGSITEDELKLSKRQPPGSTSQPLAKTELQFGSLDVATIRSLGAFSVPKQNGSSEGPKSVQPPKLISVPKQNGSSEGPKSAQPPKLITKDNELKSIKTTNGDSQRVSASSGENGSTSSPNCSSLGNGVIELERTSADLASLCISHNKAGPCSEIKNGKSNANSSLNDIHVVDSSEVVPMKENIQKALNGTHIAVKNLLPRGLINSGNLCFLHATLQALLSCSPFVQLLHELRAYDIPKIGYPTLRAFVDFISHFEMPAVSNLKKIQSLDTGKPFTPSMFEPILKIFTPDVPSSLSGRPRQEDAQEFLSFVMDQVHDEILKLDGHCSSLNGAIASPSEDDGWETVGPKNKSAVTRTQNFIPSKLSAIFGGQLRSVVKARGNRDSATIQPFLLLHLNIPGDVHTVDDALHQFSAPETLDGYKTSAAGKAASVSASKSIKIQALPKIMILHLMRFNYGNRGSTKLHKPVHFPLELVLGRELLASPLSESRRYELVATITHHGKEPSKGHYTADTRYSDGQWLRYDDASVTAIGVNKVLHDQAYLLFYKQV